MKVLVIDPDTKRAPALTQTLLTGGAEVTLASSGSFALTMLEWNRQDVVVSRARLGDMEGHELCAILKADPGTRDVRFVLVAGADEVTTAETAAAGVDLVLPPAMTGSAIVPLILRLMRADRAPVPEPAASATPAPAPAAPGAPVAESDDEEAPAVPRIRPAPVTTPQPDPPRRYVTAVTAAAAAPWSKSTSPESAGRPKDEIPMPPPSIAPPPVPGRASAAPPPLVAPPATAPPRPAPPPPRIPAPPGPASAATAPADAGAVPAELLSVPSGTFQGSLEVMELADLAQAIAAGGKSGRLILALPQGGGLLLFDKGRVVHAEYRSTVGEEAFGALLAACQGDAAGRFCFLPTPAGQASGMPRTIDKTLDRLLLSSATAIDEKG
jgi:CheY-like chemotaxis protein